MVYKIVLDKDNCIEGILSQEEIESMEQIIETDLTTDEELYMYLINSIGRRLYKGEKTKEILTIKDKDKWEFIKQEQPKSELELLKEKLEMQEQTILELSMMIGGK